MQLTSKEGNSYYFCGLKIIKKDKFGEIGLQDTTTLFTKIYEGSDENGSLLAKGILRLSLSDFARQIRTIEITNASGKLQRLRWKTKFSNFFSKALWDTYSGFIDHSLYDPTMQPREKRELNFQKGITREVYKCVTADLVSMFLLGYRTMGVGDILTLCSHSILL